MSALSRDLEAAGLSAAAPRPDVNRQLGSLAQAVRNYLFSADPRELRILDRLSAEALGTKVVGDMAPAFAERDR